jgi:hypothetical protein
MTALFTAKMILEIRARTVVSQDHNQPAAESSRIIVTEHSQELSA